MTVTIGDRSERKLALSFRSMVILNPTTLHLSNTSILQLLKQRRGWTNGWRQVRERERGQFGLQTEKVNGGVPESAFRKRPKSRTLDLSPVFKPYCLLRQRERETETMRNLKQDSTVDRDPQKTEGSDTGSSRPIPSAFQAEPNLHRPNCRVDFPRQKTNNP